MWLVVVPKAGPGLAGALMPPLMPRGKGQREWLPIVHKSIIYECSPLLSSPSIPSSRRHLPPRGMRKQRRTKAKETRGKFGSVAHNILPSEHGTTTLGGVVGLCSWVPLLSHTDPCSSSSASLTTARNMNCSSRRPRYTHTERSGARAPQWIDKFLEQNGCPRLPLKGWREADRILLGEHALHAYRLCACALLRTVVLGVGQKP